jgi:hypothetical protein
MINEYLPDDNDGRFPTHPRSRQVPLCKEQHDDRDSWPWLPDTVLAQCGPDEWRVVVEYVTPCASHPVPGPGVQACDVSRAFGSLIGERGRPPQRGEE